MLNFRLILEKREHFKTEEQNVQQQIDQVLRLPVTITRVLIVYDVFSISEKGYDELVNQILLDHVTDRVVDDFDTHADNYFASELLPGQFDVRADSALQCLQLIADNNQDTQIQTATIYQFDKANNEQLAQLKDYFINPVEKREKDLRKPLEIMKPKAPKPVEYVDGFINLTENELESFLEQEGFAMSIDDLLFIQQYFKKDEQRNPTETELNVLDTYWSDHCRHTTFLTEITDVNFEKGPINEEIQSVYESYLATRKQVYADRLNEKPVCLMDLATLAAKDLKKRGIVTTVEESEEINACSVFVKVDTPSGEENWLLMFKNETHNHPTEIEPFGGASTCLGGCIRDPLSGRAYVYQAMRVSGAANILEPIEQTLEGKLPQQQITKEAARGFSSYGNQIGLATTQVSEIYHEGYKAKRMEVGAVVAAVPADWVVRESPTPGDIILLLGGKTGRDGVGGATGSSKEHDAESLESAGAEVQKGNPPEERKIQRFFRNPEVTTLIKKCNDFGAGGVSVAIGELADGLEIYLDEVPTKYQGLNGNELALSESQERMAVVISPEDKDLFKRLAAEENLEATHVAHVTSSKRLVMKFKGQDIVNLSREFLDTNGCRQQATVVIDEAAISLYGQQQSVQSIEEALLERLSSLNGASQQGLAEQFDSTIGSSTVHMPFGGLYQHTPAEGSLQTFPLLHGESPTASAMCWGFNPYLSELSPFHGGAYAVIESMAKIVSLGANPSEVFYSFQEYFRKLGKNPKHWGLPFAALLGAYKAQQAFQNPAIGGKDSMSGTFHDLHVPPTLISFAVATLNSEFAVSNELKTTNSKLYLLKHQVNDHLLPNYAQLNENFKWLHEQIKSKHIISAGSIGSLGLAAKLAIMAFGNKIGVRVFKDIDFFTPDCGSLLLESNVDLQYEHLVEIGVTEGSDKLTFYSDSIDIETALETWQKPLSPVFPTVANTENTSQVNTFKVQEHKATPYSGLPVRPRVFIPAFPGTNCEYDSQKAFEEAGAHTHISVFRNAKDNWIDQSINDFVKQVNQSQILMLSGGFSAGDEPDGSGKFIAAVLRNVRVKEAVNQLLERDGLILGICNGFQALVKVGLLPFGEISIMESHWPTLAHNEIGRHISQIVHTKILHNHSPWLNSFAIGDVHQIAISHGEGRFVVNEDIAQQLFINGQVATQYVNLDGQPSLKRPFNPNGSFYAIEGITSIDGRILGKMGHSERKGEYLYRNIPGKVGQDLFVNGVNYFK